MKVHVVFTTASNTVGGAEHAARSTGRPREIGIVRHQGIELRQVLIEVEDLYARASSSTWPGGRSATP
jgi:hypothetical protein